MIFLRNQRITGSITVLFMITMVSWGLGRLGINSRLGDTTTLVVLIAAFKIRLVMLDFMEIRSAPKILRLFCETWIGALALTILVLHWFWTAHV